MIQGQVDYLTNQYAYGYAFNNDYFDMPVTIEIYDDTKLIAQGLADKSRDDLKNIFGKSTIGFFIPFNYIQNFNNIKIYAKNRGNMSTCSNIIKLNIRYFSKSFNLNNEDNYINLHSLFPTDFDHIYYSIITKINNSDYDQLRNHYENIGKQNGIPGSLLSYEEYFCIFCNNIFNDGLKLEIGPGYRTSLHGNNVKYFDIIDIEGCKNLANRLNISSPLIPNKIDYISPTSDLSIINDKFDLIYSAHNIEHQIDLISFFNQINLLLKPNSYFACVVPNKLYTFDHYKPLTTLIDIIAQHVDIENSHIHPFFSFYLNNMYNVHNNSHLHWTGNHSMPPHNIKDIPNLINIYKSNKKYIDLHRWTFTPDSFYEIFFNLYDIGLIPLKIIKVYNTIYKHMTFNAVFMKM